MQEQLSGILVIDKERDYTSFDVVARLRGILKIKKIGHTGTLDPEATGVLVCCTGKGTKLISMMENDVKDYRAGMKLGITTDTQDIWGSVLSEKEADCSESKIMDAILSMTGTYEQLPPMYSAKKIGGKKLYEYAREGKEVERKRVSVTINGFSDILITPEGAEFTVSVSKGTYIRTLIHDIGEKLGCGACMTSLRRLRAGKYDIGQAHTLGEVEDAMKEGRISAFLLPLDSAFAGTKKAVVKKEAASLLKNGNLLYPDDFETELSPEGDILVYLPDGVFAALYTGKDDHFKVNRMFI